MGSWIGVQVGAVSKTLLFGHIFYDFALFWQMNCAGGWLVGDWVNGLLEGVVLEKLPCGGKVTT